MANTDNVIRIPKVPSGAFNKNRPVSELLWAQVENLAAVAKGQIDEERRAIRTESQASSYIQKMSPTERRLLTAQMRREQPVKSKSVIRFPKPPADAFNDYRPVSDLLWEQVEDLAAFRKKKIEDQRRAIKTEGQASAFIQKMTAFINPPAVTTTPTRASKGAAKKRPGPKR
ncbi:MAG TPA: hypothetical protein VLM38_11255 [Blastocatellia bacterium]|nr:hypothetical protein [Blastocatellia bacterium]